MALRNIYAPQKSVGACRYASNFYDTPLSDCWQRSHIADTHVGYVSLLWINMRVQKCSHSMYVIYASDSILWRAYGVLCMHFVCSPCIILYILYCSFFLKYVRVNASRALCISILVHMLNEPRPFPGMFFFTNSTHIFEYILYKMKTTHLWWNVLWSPHVLA